MPGKTKIILTKVKCIEPHEKKGGGDDLYIKYTVDGGGIGITDTKRFPSGFNTTGISDISEGGEWITDLFIEFQDSVVVELFDKDTAVVGSADDLLFNTTYLSDEELDPVRIGGNSCEYELHTEPA